MTYQPHQSEDLSLKTKACPNQDLCRKGDACAGWCKPSNAPMSQFYTSTHGKDVYLVERATDMPIPSGYVVKELPNNLT